jgi:hypothetical protein
MDALAGFSLIILAGCVFCLAARVMQQLHLSEPFWCHLMPFCFLIPCCWWPADAMLLVEGSIAAALDV